MGVAATHGGRAHADGPVMTMHMTSSSFADGQDIPVKHTCEGVDISPPLEWLGVPAAAKTLALIVDDPDAPDPQEPTTTWVHWILYDIPVATTRLPEGALPLPAGAREGKNDWRAIGYRGPCPPIGRHRYFFKLFALDTTLPDLAHPTKAALERAMVGHVLATGSLMGTYAKLGMR